MSDGRYRVVQWATGNIGTRSLRAVLEHPDLELVRSRNPAHGDDVRGAGGEPKVCDLEHATVDAPSASCSNPGGTAVINGQTPQTAYCDIVDALKHAERALEVRQDGDRVTVRTSVRSYLAERVILTTGPWLVELLAPKHARPFTVTRQVLYWFAPRDSLEPFLPGQFPVFIWEPAEAAQAVRRRRKALQATSRRLQVMRCRSQVTRRMFESLT